MQQPTTERDIHIDQDIIFVKSTIKSPDDIKDITGYLDYSIESGVLNLDLNKVVSDLGLEEKFDHAVIKFGYERQNYEEAESESVSIIASVLRDAYQISNPLYHLYTISDFEKNEFICEVTKPGAQHALHVIIYDDQKFPLAAGAFEILRAQ